MSDIRPCPVISKSIAPQSISEILTLGARYDVIRPLEVVLRIREPEPSTEGIAEFHEVMREHPNDHGVAAIFAYTHIDAGWA